MTILWRTNYFNYKKILRESSEYWFDLQNSNHKNKKQVYSSYCCEEYSFFISRYSISIWTSKNLSVSMQKEIEDVLEIIFKSEKIRGFIDNITEDNEWILNILPNIPNIHKVSTSVKFSWNKTELEECKKFIDNLVVSEADEGKKKCIQSILNTLIINDSVGKINK